MSKFIKKMFYKQRADFEKDAIQRDQNYSLPEDVIEHKNIYYVMISKKNTVSISIIRQVKVHLHFLLLLMCMVVGFC